MSVFMSQSEQARTSELFLGSVEIEGKRKNSRRESTAFVILELEFCAL